MNGFKLIRPYEAMAEDIEAYKREFMEADSSMDGTAGLNHADDVFAWLESIALNEHEETVDKRFVPATQLVYLREADGKIVGMLSIRHRLNERLLRSGGNIGYSVRPSERRKGYASAMLADAMPYCRELGLDKVLVTCNVNNEGSRRTILKNGGVFESTAYEPEEDVTVERYWIMV